MELVVYYIFVIDGNIPKKISTHNIIPSSEFGRETWKLLEMRAGEETEAAGREIIWKIALLTHEDNVHKSSLHSLPNDDLFTFSAVSCFSFFLPHCARR